jgi:hypothetical protein
MSKGGGVDYTTVWYKGIMSISRYDAAGVKGTAGFADENRAQLYGLSSVLSIAEKEG